MRVAVVLAIFLAACGAPDADGLDPSPAGAETTEGTPMAGCADVIDVEIVANRGDGSFAFHVTVASADEGWDKYADEWEVRSPDGTTLGTRTLLHPHVDEQPFTRSLSGVRLPGETASVVVAARDSVTGYCGAEFEVAVP
jgi:hypothetical protein